MGTWGPNLYDDDDAMDVRDTISVLSKMPIDGDRALEILQKNFGSDVDLEEDGGPTFWLVAADQFEKKGIVCDRVFETAIRAIESGAHLRDLEGRGMEASDLKERKKILDKLLIRFKNPKEGKTSLKPTSAPKLFVQAGQIYSYPTMNGEGMNAWFASWETASFKPNGKGVLIILATGREYDWFPWCAYSPINVNPLSEPRLEVALESRTLLREGVGYCTPKQSHFKKMGMMLLGTVELNSKKVEELMKMCSRRPSEAVINDWSICSGAHSTTNPDLGFTEISCLLAA